MYVREKKIRRKDKTYSYWQVVQNAWVDGQAKQTVIKHLGRWRDREAATIAARMLGVLCGVDGCGQGAACERIAHPVYRGRKAKRYGGPSFGGSLERTLMLCDEHAAELGAGATLMTVAYDPNLA
jgi:hypothetical protein